MSPNVSKSSKPQNIFDVKATNVINQDPFIPIAEASMEQSIVMKKGQSFKRKDKKGDEQQRAPKNR